MDTNQASTFQHARRFERDLNGRQREILARIAKGETNAEIAAAFDMTFDGAKWNVSEILTKLGLNSREEAAAYWHWRQGFGSRARSTLRSILPTATPIKIALAGCTFAAVAVVAILFALRAGSDTSEPRFPPYRMAVITGTRADADGDGTLRIEERRDDEHVRITMYVPESDDSEGEKQVLVADGKFAWSDSTISQAYTRMSLEGMKQARPDFDRWSLFLGPARLASVDDVLEMLRNPPPESGLDSPRSAEVVGQETHLGIPTVIIEYVDVRSSGGNPGSNSENGIVTRIWVDTARMFVLRYEHGPSRTGSLDEMFITAEVTSIEYDVVFDPDTFTFVPPPGKSEATATPSAVGNSSASP